MSQAQLPTLVAYPSQAAFGRVLPKNKIYEHSGARTHLKELFVQEVDQILWQYKLAPETINVPAKEAVPEIQIFAIQLKTPELHEEVLQCIDGAIPFPILFELTFDGRTQVKACFKRPSEADHSRWVMSGYFATDWIPCDTPRIAMPVTLDLGGLYERLLTPLMPIPGRLEENLAQRVSRIEQFRSKQREVDKTAKLLTNEKQFNRKVEINAALRNLKTELEQLSR